MEEEQKEILDGVVIDLTMVGSLERELLLEHLKIYLINFLVMTKFH